MNGRTIARALLLVVLIGAAIGIGVSAYNAGVSAGLAALPPVTASGDAIPLDRVGYGYGYGPYVHRPWGWGFGFFGILFWIFGILLLVGLIRAAFGGWRGGGPYGPRG